MLIPLLALAGGIVLLIFSADKFVEGAAATAKLANMPPLLIGMVVVGFGSSMPEMVISTLSASGGNPGLALGNALGSNIANIALILGITALLTPIVVKSRVLKRELPYLLGLTAIAALFFYDDRYLDSSDGLALIMLFLMLIGWSVYETMTVETDVFADNVEQAYEDSLPLKKALTYLILGLAFLVISSRILVWGGIEVASALGVSDLVIGLTVVAIGTSLPELASTITAVRKNEHDLAIGNVIGSNMFNTSVVIGITAVLSPTELEPAMLTRDMPVVIMLTVMLAIMAVGLGGKTGRINRYEGGALLGMYVTYTLILIFTSMPDDTGPDAVNLLKTPDSPTLELPLNYAPS